MARVSLEEVFKSFGKTEVIHGISCDIKDGEFIVLLGPSGCGKTTLLRIVAGLTSADAGDVVLDGRAITGVPAHKRKYVDNSPV